MSGAQPCYWLLIWWPVSTQLRPHRIELISNRQMLGLWSWPGLKWIQNRIFEQDLGPRLRLFWDLQGRGASFILQALIFDPLIPSICACTLRCPSRFLSHFPSPFSPLLLCLSLSSFPFPLTSFFVFKPPSIPLSPFAFSFPFPHPFSPVGRKRSKVQAYAC